MCQFQRLSKALLAVALGLPTSGALAQFPGTAASNVYAYQVTVKKIELCVDGACTISRPLPSAGALTFDIASRNVSTKVGDYLSNIQSSAAFGPNFDPPYFFVSHVRVTVDSRLGITADGFDQGLPCRTRSDDGNGSTTQTSAGDIGLASSSQTPGALFVPVIGTYRVPGLGTAVLSPDLFQQLNVSRPNASDVVVTYPLQTRFDPRCHWNYNALLQCTPGGDSRCVCPTLGMTVSFNVRGRANFINVNGSCQAFPLPPFVKVSMP